MFRDFRHRCTMIFKVEQTLKRAKTAERNSTTCECILHQLAIKNVNVFVLITIYCQRNSIFLRPKNIQYLAGYHDWRPDVCYFQPWTMLFPLLVVMQK